jgi:predicted ATPase
MSTRGSARVALQNLDMARDRLLCHVHPIAGNDAISERAVNRVETQARDAIAELRRRRLLTQSGHRRAWPNRLSAS